MVAFGRLRDHDPRSRQFAFTGTGSDATVRHAHYGPILDQGDLGACTGYAMTNWLNSHPAHRARSKYLSGADAREFYHRATQLDPWPEEWPPTDTGSSGLAVAKAAKEAGKIASYRWIFGGVDQLKQALQTTPVLAGTAWLENMIDYRDGYMSVTGREIGGHEYAILGWNRPSGYFTIINSWGSGWGRGGYARIGERDMQWLLDHGGDLTVPML